MKNRDIIITSLQSWDIPIGSNAIDIAKEMAKNNRVLYVNSPLDIFTILRKKNDPGQQHRMRVIAGKESPIRNVQSNLWVIDIPFPVLSINGLPDGSLFDICNRINNKRVFSFIRKQAEALGFRKFIHFIDNDIYRSFYSKEYLRPERSVYYRRDNLHPFPYWRRHIARLEPQLIGKSELVVCNSSQLTHYAAQHNIHSYNVGQGVDLTAYDASRIVNTPPALTSIQKPLIGYIGDINSLRLDPDLLYNIAVSRPQYSFVMIGKEDEAFQSHALHHLHNVHFNGSIAKQEVPMYMASMQVCINPQAVNEITLGNYPRKVDEYLAMGKPVVATSTPAMELFKDHVYLCNTTEEYCYALDEALISDSAEMARTRIQFAHTHSWEKNVSAIYNYLEQEN